MNRQLSFMDRAIISFDAALRSIFVPDHRCSERPNPAAEMNDVILSPQNKRHVAGLMRVNHAGEVCAQALYQGQALTAKLPAVKAQMTQAAIEEVDHLAWCEERLRELNSTTGILNPFWYGAAFAIGAFAGLMGDRWSLGFVAETERQVTAHLESHLARLPQNDKKTHAILVQMRIDEIKHAQQAQQAGAAELPFLIQQGMRCMAKLMTKTNYYF